MSSFLANHPISHTLLVSTVFVAIYVTLFTSITTLRDIRRIPQVLWPAAGRSRRRWVIAGWVGLLLFPLGAIAAIFWWARVRRHLAALPKPPETFFPFGPLSPLFSDEGGASLWILRSAIGLFALVGFIVGGPAIGRWAVGDPTDVNIGGAHSRSVNPRTYIQDNCPLSVRRTQHLESNDVELDGHSYQRWSVVPVPGHLDEVLVDTDSGHVICP